jgi:hypothetical protein
MAQEAPNTTPVMFKHPSTLRLFAFTLASQFLAQRVALAGLGGVEGGWGDVLMALMHALHSHPAVETLTWDFGFSLFAFGYWMVV